MAEEPDVGFLYGTIIIGEPHDPQNHSRNVCIFADGEVDRCPTGTGVSARAALHYVRGELNQNETFTVESILGTTFTGRLVKETRVGDVDAVVPTISGTAWITGFAQYVVDPQDPFPNGFTVGDLWGGQQE